MKSYTINAQIKLSNMHINTVTLNRRKTTNRKWFTDHDSTTLWVNSKVLAGYNATAATLAKRFLMHLARQPVSRESFNYTRQYL